MWKKKRFYKIFKNKKVVLPVIHVESLEQAIENTEIAVNAGADGVFLINHHYNYEHLLKTYWAVRNKFPNLWIGMNFLDLGVHQVMGKIPSCVNGIWSDNAEVNEKAEKQIYPQLVKDKIKENKWKGLYFGGLAFKYQRKVDDLEAAVNLGKKYMDVITTSGPGTGLSADIEKIKRMSKAANQFPLAIASGITPDNISNYLPYADAFLVATGISKSFDQLDEKLVNALIQKVRAYE